MENKNNLDDITKKLLQNAEESQTLLSKQEKLATDAENIINNKEFADEGQNREVFSTTEISISERMEESDENKSSNIDNDSINSTAITSNNKKNYGKVFEKWSVSDIVFLAIVTTITLLTGAVMPLLINIPLFGIIQLGLSLQYSIFITIALLKVRKTGALLFMSIISGIVLAFMNPIMFLILLLCALICEVIAIIISKGFKSTVSCILSAILYIPLSLPFLYIYYALIFPTSEVGAAVGAMRGSNLWVSLGMSLAVIAVNVIGSIIGYFISKELSKMAFYKK